MCSSNTSLAQPLHRTAAFSIFIPVHFFFILEFTLSLSSRDFSNFSLFLSLGLSSRFTSVYLSSAVDVDYSVDEDAPVVEVAPAVEEAPAVEDGDDKGTDTDDKTESKDDKKE